MLSMRKWLYFRCAWNDYFSGTIDPIHNRTHVPKSETFIGPQLIEGEG